jgi:serine/threonine protein kinase
VSESAKDLISKLLVKSPDIRLNAVEALNHPYLLKSLAYNSRQRVRDYSEKVIRPSLTT